MLRSVIVEILIDQIPVLFEWGGINPGPVSDIIQIVDDRSILLANSSREIGYALMPSRPDG
jgi:hypothetical protein